MPLSALKEHAVGYTSLRPTSNLPATTVMNLFAVAGRVRITQVLGLVTTAIQAQANATKVVFTPTGGSQNDLSGTLDITGDVVGTLYSITGTVASAMIDSGANGVILAMANPLVLSNGIIKLSCAATNTGQVQWEVMWVPISFGASVTAL